MKTFQQFMTEWREFFVRSSRKSDYEYAKRQADAMDIRDKIIEELDEIEMRLTKAKEKGNAKEAKDLQRKLEIMTLWGEYRMAKLSDDEEKATRIRQTLRDVYEFAIFT